MIVIEEETVFTIEDFDRIMEFVRRNPSPLTPLVTGHYVVHIPPENRQWAVMWEAKRRWKAQYRAERIARRSG